jgi:hypothetical protein
MRLSWLACVDVPLVSESNKNEPKRDVIPFAAATIIHINHISKNAISVKKSSSNMLKRANVTMSLPLDALS